MLINLKLILANPSASGNKLFSNKHVLRYNHFVPTKQSQIQRINLRKVLPPTITTAILDMDDLMINSHPLHMKIFKTILQSYRIFLDDPTNPFTREEEASQFGRKISDMCTYFIKKYNLSVNSETMLRQFNDLMIPIFEKTDIQPMPGLNSLIQALVSHNFSLVLASSAKKEKIDIILKKLELTGAFPIIVSGEDEIGHGKPAPDIFLKAAQKAGVRPGECMVFEDARNGVEAAKTAGMYAIGVHNKFAMGRLGLKQNLTDADIQVYGLDSLSFE